MTTRPTHCVRSLCTRATSLFKTPFFLPCCCCCCCLYVSMPIFHTLLHFYADFTPHEFFKILSMHQSYILTQNSLPPSFLPCCCCYCFYVSISISHLITFLCRFHTSSIIKRLIDTSARCIPELYPYLTLSSSFIIAAAISFTFLYRFHTLLRFYADFILH